MTSDTDYVRLRALFDSACELDPAAQHAFLDALEPAVAHLRAPLTRLLLQDREADDAAFADVASVSQEAIEQLVSSEFAPGQQLKEFRILAEIGRGGMGRVFHAVRQDGELHQDVAIKLLRPELVNPALLKRFSSERAILAGLEHPGICRLIDTGTLASGIPFAVMELVRGEPLLAWCDQRRLGIEARLSVFRKVLAAVAHAHRNLVVHRDIKSGNILVNDEGQPKLLDFGIAKPLDQGDPESMTQTAERMFTPSNAAPEQILGRPATVACDVYGLGTLLYALLCGKGPFESADLRRGELEEIILHRPPPPLHARIENDAAAQARGFHEARDLARRLRGDLDAIVQRCLRKAPAERYPTVDALDQDIANVLASRPIQERRSELWYRTAKFLRRNRTASVLAGSLLLSIVTAGVLLMRQSAALEQQRNEAVAERDRAQSAVDLLREAFLAADPSRAAGKAVTAGAILDAAKPRLEQVRQSQPRLYAELALTLAEVELAIGEDGEAAQLTLAALGETSLAAWPKGLVRALRILAARALMERGELDQAQQQLAHADPGPRTDDIDWLIARARLHSLRREYEPAITLGRRVVNLLAGAPADDDAANRARWQLADALRSADRFDEALRSLDETIAWQQSGEGGAVRALLSRLRRAETLRESGRIEDAIIEVRQVADAISTQFGADSAFAGRALGTLGTSLYNADRLDEAAESLQRSVDAWTAALGPNHPNTIRTLFNLAQVLAETPQGLARARQLAQQAIDRAELQFGVRAPMLPMFRVNLARMHLDASDRDSAVSALAEPEALEQLAAGAPRLQAQAQELLAKLHEQFSCPSLPADDRAARQCGLIATASTRLQR